MNSVIVCHGCGRTIDSEFLYCPWCSLSRVTSDASLSIAGVFDRLNRMQECARSIQIKDLERELDEIERGLDEFDAAKGGASLESGSKVKDTSKRRVAAVTACE